MTERRVVGEEYPVAKGRSAFTSGILGNVALEQPNFFVGAQIAAQFTLELLVLRRLGGVVLGHRIIIFWMGWN